MVLAKNLKTQHNRAQFIVRTDHVKGVMLSRLKNIPVDNIHPWLVCVEPYKEKRTSAQNRRYWGILEDWFADLQSAISEISQSTGYTPQECKRLIKRALIGGQLDCYLGFLDASSTKGIHDILKGAWPLPVEDGEKTTTELKKKKFTDYADEIGMELDKFYDAILLVRDKVA